MLRLRAVGILALCGALASAWSGADQAAYLSKEEAQRGYALIPTGGEIRHFCAPCGDTTWRAEEVRRKSIDKTDFQDYYEVRVNGVGVDLAYVYVPEGDRWVNVARRAGIEVSDVPETLDQAGSEASPQSSPDGARHDYKGLIDGRLGFYMTLQRDGFNLDGSYRYNSKGLPIDLTGSVNESDEVNLTEAVEGRTTGRFHGKVAPDMATLEGTWQDPEGNRTLPFKAERIARNRVDNFRIDLGKVALNGTVSYPLFAGATQPFTDRLRRELRAAFDEFEEQAREMAADFQGTPPADFEYGADDYEIAYFDESTASVYYREFTYAGGAHPNTNYRAFNFVIEADGEVEEVELEDLFKAGADYMKVLNKPILDELRRQEAQWVVDGEVKSFSPEELAFVLTPRGLRFLFSPYAVGPYVQGGFEVDVPYEALGDVLDRGGVLKSVLSQGTAR